MITNSDLSTLTLSPTNKDYYQVWNELLEVAQKLSNRWDPTTTNESDPGIVLLKVLTAITDKLNYNIDKNILEAFMPTAAQRDSMQKLCDMMGYNMKYYQSATTEVSFSYIGEPNSKLNGARLPKFTAITNADNEITYTTVEPMTISTSFATSVNCIQGAINHCQTNNSYTISIAQLDTSLRYYLPETAIAENGIFVYNMKDGQELLTAWRQVGNLNTTQLGQQVYKFGYDSKLNLPYLQFPEDISALIQDGLSIYYIRTAGANGNISAQVLSTFSEVAVDAADGTGGSVSIIPANFIVRNASAAMNGADPESITSAYNGFKKTVGTFNTLVTCRDYMNYIYQLEENSIPLVSNIVAADIRDDINGAVKICEFNEYGLYFANRLIKQANSNTASNMDNFTVRLYPFRVIYYKQNTEREFLNSFQYDTSNCNTIVSRLEDPDENVVKTLAHQFSWPIASDEIICIKNYLQLDAKLTTANKVSEVEGAAILSNVYTNLYKNFNSRQLDFGEEIPFDSILECIENADTRIRNVALNEPTLITKIMTADNEEYLASFSNALDDTETRKNIRAELLTRLIAQNVLAGRVPLFNYDNSFATSLNEMTVPSEDPAVIQDVNKLTGECEITLQSYSAKNLGLVLDTNETINFRTQNYRTVKTFPAYVNYWLILSSDESSSNTRCIPKNVDYQLKTDEYLLINYTSAETEESSSKVYNLVYKAGNIIRPNFDMYDSDAWQSGEYAADGTVHTTSKTSGFSFANVDLDAMFQFGAQEQVEIREPVEISLSAADKVFYLFILLNNNHIIKSNESYTLEDGEYIFFTDQYKYDFIYYGSGTVIDSDIDLVSTRLSDETAEDTSIDNSDLIENLIEQGVYGIPWKAYTLSDPKTITIKEYQYITLGKGDRLDSIEFKDQNNKELNNNWYKISKDADGRSTAGFTYAEDISTSSPSELAPLPIDEAYWEVRSGLSINLGPDTAQTLRYKDESDKYTLIDSIQVTMGNSDTTIEPTSSNENISIKTNVALQTDNTSLDTRITITDASDAKSLVTIKQFESKEATATYKDTDSSDLVNLTLHNFGEYWTKIPGSKDNLNLAETMLYTNITSAATSETETKLFGLVMIYVQATTENSFKTGFKKYFPTITAYITDEEELKIFNNEESWWTWEDDGNKAADTVSGKTYYYLKPGINIVKIPQTCAYLSLCAEADSENGSKTVFIIGDPSVIICNETTNDDLTADILGIDYKKLGFGYENQNSYIVSPQDFCAKLLKKIAEWDPDHRFYYNYPSSAGQAISINTTALETAISPATWYDYNNRANKFTISEIDTNYMKSNSWSTSGIQLTRSSKLNR